MNRWHYGLEHAIDYIAQCKQWEMADETGLNRRLVNGALQFVKEVQEDEVISMDDEEQAWVFRSTANLFTHWIIQTTLRLQKEGIVLHERVLGEMLAPLNYIAAESIVHWATEGEASDITPEELAKVWRLNPWEGLRDSSEGEGFDCE